jgi:molybdate transport system substrate-binding protein
MPGFQETIITHQSYSPLRLKSGAAWSGPQFWFQQLRRNPTKPYCARYADPMTGMKMLERLVSVIASLICASAAAQSAEIKVLSDGPLQPALTEIAGLFQQASKHTVRFDFGFSPVISKRIMEGEVADVVLVQPDFIEQLWKAGKVLGGEHPVVARIGVGLFVRAGADAPPISTVEALKRALQNADTLVFANVGSGKHFASVLEQLGIAEEVKSKIVRGNPAEVVERVVQGRGKDIGVGTITLIPLDKRLKLVGSLPQELQGYLVSEAAVMTNATSPDAARDFIRFLGAPTAKAAFAASGAD